MAGVERRRHKAAVGEKRPGLFYLATAGTEAAVMSVRFERAATWTAAAPTKLIAGPFFFRDGAGSGIGRTYDVSLDGPYPQMCRRRCGRSFSAGDCASRHYANGSRTFRKSNLLKSRSFV
jgi:hypothetical protein